jgi:hypothetical protein
VENVKEKGRKRKDEGKIYVKGPKKKLRKEQTLMAKKYKISKYWVSQKGDVGGWWYGLQADV